MKDSNALEAALKINPSKTPIEESRQRSPPPDEDRLSPPNTPGRGLPFKVTENFKPGNTLYSDVAAVV
ncbi:MAG: hypothetical protein QW057_02360 [Candidatus Bathyarchaeia archaeon]